jgi:hypothetical protein
MSAADCQDRLAKIARVLDTPHWAGGATHSIETTDRGLFGIGTEVYFVASLQARPDDCAVFLHRTQRKAIERRLVKTTRAGWVVKTISPKGRGRVERLDRKTWCGGYCAVASMMPAERKDRLAAAIANRRPSSAKTAE